MKKLIILLLIAMTLFAGCSSDNVEDQNGQENQSNQPSEELFLEILKTNEDGLNYMEKNPDTKVINWEKISPNQFEELENQTQFKALYEDLPQKDLYRVDFKSDNSELSLMTIIDLENKKVINIYGNFVRNLG